MTTDVTLTSLVLNPWDGTFATGDKIALSYADLDYTPSASDPLKSTSGDVFKVYIGGTRIYRSSDQEYAGGSGFLEDGDVSGETLNGQSAAWTATSDNVWTIETSNQRILLDKSEVLATSLYGSSGLNVSINSGVIIELRRAVQNLKTTAVDFSNASILTEQDLDNSAKNVFHVSQQAIIATENAMLYDSGTDTYRAYQPGTTTNKRIANVDTPTATTDAANKAYVDGSSNTATVAANISNVNTVAGISGNVTTVAGIASNVTAVANDATDIGTVAGKATEIGRLGTADAVADMAILGTTDVVADLNTLGTADIVADMNLLATSSNVAAMALLGTSDAVADMNTLGTSDIVADMNLLATTDNVSNMDTCADNITNVNAVAGSIAGSLTYAVTVPSSVFVLDGVNNPTITLTRGFTYTFDQSAGTNSGHLLLFKDSAGNAYTNGVTSSGTLGQAGAKTVFVVPANAPDSLRYYCQTHGNSMGNTITVVNNDLGEVASIGATNINTVATNAESNAIVMGIALG